MTWEFRVIAMAICTSAAAILAWRKTDGWGWFLFVGFVAVVANP